MFDDPVGPGIFGVVAPARPADQVLVLLVIRIGEGFEELLIAPGSGDVLGWTGPGRLQEPLWHIAAVAGWSQHQSPFNLQAFLSNLKWSI